MKKKLKTPKFVSLNWLLNPRLAIFFVFSELMFGINSRIFFTLKIIVWCDTENRHFQDQFLSFLLISLSHIIFFSLSVSLSVSFSRNHPRTYTHTHTRTYWQLNNNELNLNNYWICKHWTKTFSILTSFI